MDPTETAPLPQKMGVDRNMNGLSGEFFVAAELLKRGLQASITLGNAKHVDLFAQNPKTGQRFAIQVKSLREEGYFPVRAVQPNQIYVFVVLNEPGVAVQYFIVQGNRLLDEPDKYDLHDPKFPGIYTKALAKFAGAWDTFGC
jgi:hypothetical protein